MVSTAAQIWRNWITDGVPSSGVHEPDKIEIRAWGAWLEGLVAGFTANGGLIYSSKAAMDADLAHGANSMAWVIGDPVAANNGVYGKVGASGTGSWTRRSDLPFSFIIATDAGAGTANAIQATTAIPVSSSALVWMNIFEANTSSPVTVSFNGGSALTIKTNSGNDAVAGGLVAGMIVLGIVSGGTFRLVSDQASSAIVAAAEAAAEQAADYADFIRNNWAVNGPFTGTGSAANYALTIDPGSPNNMLPVVGGVVQMITETAYSLVYVGGNPYININVPAGVTFEVRIGNKVDVNTPADGSVSTGKIADGAVSAAKLATNAVETAKINDGAVTPAKLAANAVETAKIANDAVTYDKLQNVSATARLLGRATAGAGNAEELTATQLRDTFFPAGSIVDSSLAIQATSAFGVSATIPIDNTVPQIGEGTQILTLSFTPKKTTNKLRATVVVNGSNSGAGDWVAALFSAGAANAIAAEVTHCSAAGDHRTMKMVHEWTPGVTTAINITVRVGVAAPNAGQTFTINPAYFGSVNHCSLLVEEIAG
jgi:hypothetical protein